MRNTRKEVIAVGLTIFLSACLDSTVTQLPVPPSLDLDFTTGTLPAKLTFTRTSSATYMGEDGLLKTAPAHIPRFEYDPETSAIRGLLIEEKATNLVLHSEQLDQWNRQGVTLQAQAGPAPSGDLSAERIIPANTNDKHQLYLEGPIAASDTFYTVSCYFKPDGYACLGVFLGADLAGEGSNKAGYVFDVLKNRMLAVASHPAMRLLNPTIQKLKNEYYRCAFSVRTTDMAALALTIQVRPDYGFSEKYPADGQLGGYVWGAQLELGYVLSSYIPTTSAITTRQTDLCLIENTSDWFNEREGAWVAETLLGTRRVARIVGYNWPGNFLGISPNSPASTETWNGFRNLVKNGNQNTGIVRHAMTYTDTSRTLTREGLKPVTSKTPNGKVRQVAIGANTNGSNALNAHIRHVAYYTYQLSDSVLQQLTQ